MNELPAGWAWTELSKVCASIADGDHQAPPQVPKGIPFLVIGNIRTQTLDFTDCRHVPLEYFESIDPVRRPQKGDVLYSLVGSYGISVLVRHEVPFCVQRHIGILRPSRGISSSFLALLMSSRTIFDQATECATGTAQMTVPLSGLRRIRIPLPPHREQERIVAAVEEQFSRLDAGIASLKRIRKNLKLMRSALLQKLVTSALTLSPDSGITQGSELPQLTDGWRWTTLGNLIVDGLQNGLYLPASRYGCGVPILRINDFQNDWVRPKEDLKLVNADAEQAKAFALEAGDLVINRVNSMTHLGKCLVVRNDLAGALFESNMMRIRLTGDIESSYVELYLQSPLGRSFLLKNAKWAVNQASINQTDVRATPIAAPPLEEQKRIILAYEHGIKSLLRIDEEVQMNLHRSASLRSSILAAAFSGKLVAHDVGDEPASALIERIAAERVSSTRHKRALRRKPEGYKKGSLNER